MLFNRDGPRSRSTLRLLGCGPTQSLGQHYSDRSHRRDGDRTHQREGEGVHRQGQPHAALERHKAHGMSLFSHVFVVTTEDAVAAPH